MWRTGRMLAVLAIGCSLLLAPAATASTSAPVGHQERPAAELVLAQGAPVGPQIPSDARNDNLTPQQRWAIGITGIVLIALVAASRKMRKKPIIGIPWKKNE